MSDARAVEKYQYDTDHGPVTLTPEQVRDYLVSGSSAPTKQDIMMFIALCRYRKLNPFLKEAYCIKYSEHKPASLVVGRGLHEKLAAKNPQFDGIESGIIIKTADGIEQVDGAFYDDEKNIVGGWATGYRKDWKVPKKVRVKYSDYVGHEKSVWGTLPALMIEKVAIVQCLRSMFPEELAGMYSVDESRAMEQEDPQPVAEAVRDRLIPNVETGRDEIEKLIDTYQYILAPDAVASIRIDMDGANLNEIREVYSNLKAQCDTLKREEQKAEKLDAIDGINKGIKIEVVEDEGVEAAFDAPIEKRGDLF
jgi:phage recombination protein Bet